MRSSSYGLMQPHQIILHVMKKEQVVQPFSYEWCKFGICCVIQQILSPVLVQHTVYRNSTTAGSVGWEIRLWVLQSACIGWGSRLRTLLVVVLWTATSAA
jgi:hypothetical protein